MVAALDGSENPPESVRLVLEVQWAVPVKSYKVHELTQMLVHLESLLNTSERANDSVPVVKRLTSGRVLAVSTSVIM